MNDFTNGKRRSIIIFHANDPSLRLYAQIICLQMGERGSAHIRPIRDATWLHLLSFMLKHEH